MTALARRGYNQAAIEAEQARLDAVTQTNSAHETAKAAAVRATTDRDAAAKALDDWWAEFRAVAQVALKDRPDLWLCWVYNKKPPADAPSAGGLTSCPSKSKLVLESHNITDDRWRLSANHLCSVEVMTWTWLVY